MRRRTDPPPPRSQLSIFNQPASSCQLSHCFEIKTDLFCSEFLLLTIELQQQLLHRNSPLFVQLLAGAYFGARSGLEQLRFLLGLGLELPTSGSTIPPSTVPKVSFEMVNQSSGSISERSHLENYQRLVERFGDLEVFGIERQAMIAFLVLFRRDANCVAGDADALKSVTDASEEIFCVHFKDASSTPGWSLEKLHNLLSQMSIFWSQQINLESFRDSNPDHLTLDHVVVRYTGEEESWLQNQLSTIKDAFHSVSAGDDHIKEYLMWSLGVPLSKKFFLDGMKMTFERVTRMSKALPEFGQLPATLQNEILARTCPLLSALMTFKCETCSTGLEQMKVGMSQIDEKSWQDRFSTVFSKQGIKMMRAEDMSDVIRQQRTQFGVVFEAVSGLIRDDVIYSIMILLLLTWTRGTFSSQSTKPLEALNNTFQVVLKRRLDSENKNSAAIMSKIRESLFRLEEFSEIIRGMGEKMQKENGSA